MAICPFVSHHDRALYPPDAWSFNPDRPPLSIGDGTAVVTSVAGLSFGGGSYRCPGRFFAEMEVALIVQQLLWQFNLKLLESSDPAPQKSIRGSEESTESPFFMFLRNILGDHQLSWGMGLFEGMQRHGSGSTSSSDGEAVKATTVESWRHSGDASGLLPPCNLVRLVGLKVPSGPCFVTLTRREHEG